MTDLATYAPTVEDFIDRAIQIGERRERNRIRLALLSGADLDDIRALVTTASEGPVPLAQRPITAVYPDPSLDAAAVSNSGSSPGQPGESGHGPVA